MKRRTFTLLFFFSLSLSLNPEASHALAKKFNILLGADSSSLSAYSGGYGYAAYLSMEFPIGKKYTFDAGLGALKRGGIIAEAIPMIRYWLDPVISMGGGIVGGVTLGSFSPEVGAAGAFGYTFPIPWEEFGIILEIRYYYQFISSAGTGSEILFLTGVRFGQENTD